MCLSCKDQMKLHPWKFYTDTSDCYKVYTTIDGYSKGIYTKAEAKSKLEQLDLSDMDSYRDGVKRVIKEILSGGKVEDTKTEKSNSDSVLSGGNAEIESAIGVDDKSDYSSVETEEVKTESDDKVESEKSDNTSNGFGFKSYKKNRK